MSISFRIYSTLEGCPLLDDLIEALEELDFEIEVESELEEDEDGMWDDVLVWESSLEEPVRVVRLTNLDEIGADTGKLLELLNLQSNHCSERVFLEGVLKSCVGGFIVEIPETMAEEDNALLLGSQVAQFLSSRCDGFYVVDSEGVFDDNGEFLLELIEEEQ